MSLVLTLVLEMASSCRSSCRNPDDGTWDPLVLICCDIIKAYPKDTAPPRVRAKCWNLRNVPKTTDAADSLRMVNWYAIFPGCGKKYRSREVCRTISLSHTRLVRTGKQASTACCARDRLSAKCG